MMIKSKREMKSVILKLNLAEDILQISFRQDKNFNKVLNFFPKESAFIPNGFVIYVSKY